MMVESNSPVPTPNSRRSQWLTAARKLSGVLASCCDCGCALPTPERSSGAADCGNEDQASRADMSTEPGHFVGGYEAPADMGEIGARVETDGLGAPTQFNEIEDSISFNPGNRFAECEAGTRLKAEDEHCDKDSTRKIEDSAIKVQPEYDEPSKDEQAARYAPSCVHVGLSEFSRAFVLRKLSPVAKCLTAVDVAPQVVFELDDHKQYRVFQSDHRSDQVTITNVTLDRVVFLFSQEFIEVMCEADILTVQVAPSEMKRIVDGIFEGLRHRCEASEGKCFSEPLPPPMLHIIIVESSLFCPVFLEEELRRLAEVHPKVLQYLDAHVRFVHSVADCFVVPAKDQVHLTDLHPLDVVAEAHGEWYVTKPHMPIEQLLPGLTYCEDVDKYSARTWLVTQTAVAAALFYGAAFGCETVAAALSRQHVREIVEAVAKEAGEMLEPRYDFSNEHGNYPDEVIARLANVNLVMKINPISRKMENDLNPVQRLVRPINYASDLGTTPEHIARCLGVAMAYDRTGNVAAYSLDPTLTDAEAHEAIEQLTGLKNTKTIKSIIAAWNDARSQFMHPDEPLVLSRDHYGQWNAR